MLDRIKDIDNSDHYSWGEVCDGWHFIKTESLSVIREKMPKGSQENKHFHARALQFFYILSGEATFEIDEQIYVIKENQGITIKPTEKHKIMNNTDFDLEFLVISNPPSHGDRIDIE
jgi:mannose-6-phosphate isomerase-like protein (cupin superfamily)